MCDYKIDFENLPWESPMTGVRHKIIKDKIKQLRVVEYGKEMPPHWCEKGHMGYVLAGQMEIAFDTTSVLLGPGDFLHIPTGADHRHRARVIGDKAVLMMVEDV